MARKYRMGRRAERLDQTRQRIIEATVLLHEREGGANTSISDIARQAGVERMTVYRHFPDEKALYTACTTHYLQLHPPPDPDLWLGIHEPAGRLRSGLTQIYAYHRRTEPMFARAARDLDQIPVLPEILAPFFAHWNKLRDTLAAPWKTRRTQRARQIRAVIGHAISFATWQSLIREQKMREAAAIEFWVQTLRCLARGPGTAAGK
jgi:AcrR family transcriptional regulator